MWMISDLLSKVYFVVPQKEHQVPICKHMRKISTLVNLYHAKSRREIISG
jgi:hypothetical protein